MQQGVIDQASNRRSQGSGIPVRETGAAPNTELGSSSNILGPLLRAEHKNLAQNSHFHNLCFGVIFWSASRPLSRGPRSPRSKTSWTCLPQSEHTPAALIEAPFANKKTGPRQ